MQAAVSALTFQPFTSALGHLSARRGSNQAFVLKAFPTQSGQGIQVSWSKLNICLVSQCKINYFHSFLSCKHREATKRSLQDFVLPYTTYIMIVEYKAVGSYWATSETFLHP